MSAQDGGPAFPVSGAPGATEDFPGMSLRDYFAAKAMQVILPIHLKSAAALGKVDDNVEDVICGAAYAFANAMLKARQR